MLNLVTQLLILSLVQRHLFTSFAASSNNFAATSKQPKFRVNVLCLTGASDASLFQANTFARHLRVQNNAIKDVASSYGNVYPDSFPWLGNHILSNVEIHVNIHDTAYNVNLNLQKTVSTLLQLLVRKHSKCDRSQNSTDYADSTNAVAHPALHIIVGPGFSSEAKAISQLTSFYNLVLISGSATSPTLTDRSRYPNFFRTCPSDGEGPYVVAKVPSYFGYSQINAIYQNEGYVMDFREVFEPVMKTSGIRVENSFVYGPHDDRAYFHMFSLLRFRAQSHVWLTPIFSSQFELFCAMFKYGNFRGAQFFGFIYGTLSDSHWLDPPPPTAEFSEYLYSNECTTQQLRSVVDGAIQLTADTASEDDSVDIVGLRPTEFRSDVKDAFEISSQNKSKASFFRRFHPLMFSAFDALTAAALTLDRVEHDLRQNHNKSLAYFYYNDSHVAEQIVAKLTNLSFQGLTGQVGFSATGDRINNTWTLRQFQGSKFVAVGRYQVINATSHNITFYGKLIFPTENSLPPLQFAVAESWATPANITLIALGVVACVVGAVGLAFYVHKKLKEYSLQTLLGSTNQWLVKQEALKFTAHQSQSLLISSSTLAISSSNAMLHKMSRSSSSSIVSEKRRERQQNSPFMTCSYEGVRVGLFPLQEQRTGRKIVVDREFATQLQRLRTCPHENLCRFIGIVQMSISEASLIHVIMADGPKCTLTELLADSQEECQLDETCGFLFIKDLQHGLTEVHRRFGFHGRLSSTICMVDTRLFLRISDYGFTSHRQEAFYSSFANHKHWLWTAPEILTHVVRTSHTSGDEDPDDCTEINSHKLDWKKCDVYSTGIVVAEVFCHTSPPFNLEEKSDTAARQLLETLAMESNTAKSMWKVEFTARRTAKDISDLALACLGGDITHRPTVHEIGEGIRSMMKVRKLSDNLTEMLMQRLETYAADLAGLVEQRTAALMEEENKVRRLLYQILPPSVADALKNGEGVPPQTFESVTVHFSDIVGFTSIAAESTPLEVVDLLNDLYNVFDLTISKFDVYKVETVGDAYMVVSGLPTPNGEEHARCIARMGLLLIEHVTDVFKIRHRPDEHLLLRIGIHTGPCAAGVVGFVMPRYCLFGDTVNTASRMESMGEPLRIHASEATVNTLRNLEARSIGISGPEFLLESRGGVEIKGKGIMETFWVTRATLGGQ